MPLTSQSNPHHYSSDVLIIGGGLAGITAAIEALDANLRVTLVDAESEDAFGGQANQAFGGMLLINTPEQRKNGIEDSPELLFQDWCNAAQFGDNDIWGKRWAHEYAYHCKTEIYDWLQHKGIRFFPAVQWVERGNYGDGNSRPRYHIAWGCGRGIVQTLIQQLRNHANNDRLTLLFEHRVESLAISNRHVSGCVGLNSEEKAFSVQAKSTLVCSGGINGNLEQVRRHWDPIYGTCPNNILNGVSPAADGSMHNAVSDIGGQVINLGYMWNYAAGIAHPKPQFPQHGLSLIPPRSALWFNAIGARIGPAPMITGFDTHDLCKRTGQQPGQFTWQVMNWRIAAKELAISGTDENPHFRDKKMLKVIWQTLRGNHKLVHWLTTHCPDVVMADTLDQLIEKMQKLEPNFTIDAKQMRADIAHYDQQINLGASFWNDDQLRRLQQLRQWRSDRLRTCKFQKIIDPKAGPLIAIRERIISRKSMGGVQTNLNAQVLNMEGIAISGLYAAGEAAGFGGGGISGIRSLEGTFLSNCIFNARRAIKAITTAAE
ncbi:FAD-binding dehydrogenase [Aliidiomarina indica]|uniref:FAD-binding dehydrogenase n=1 Tax=Aliidiomarina indica TaxID=2749147 RepID=UPI00188E0A8D|nr:FAD-binding dehydrogenase [Aliidiomarina indica]